MTRRDRDRGLACPEVNPHRRFVGYGRAPEREHDAGAQQLLQRVQGEIRREKGKVLGIRSEIDLKREVSKELERVRKDHGRLRPRDRQNVAEEFGLKVVNGKILIPDIQLEVQRRDGERVRCNLEYASKHYGRGKLAAKAKAGFVVSRAGLRLQDTPIFGRRVKDGPDLIGRILS